MEMDTLTEVTDSHKDHKIIAYIIPFERTERGLVLCDLLWLTDETTKINIRQYRRQWDISYKGMDKVPFILFNQIGADWGCFPYLKMFIHYRPIKVEEYPLCIGRCEKLDNYIAQQYTQI